MSRVVQCPGAPKCRKEPGIRCSGPWKAPRLCSPEWRARKWPQGQSTHGQGSRESRKEQHYWRCLILPPTIIGGRSAPLGSLGKSALSNRADKELKGAKCWDQLLCYCFPGLLLPIPQHSGLQKPACLYLVWGPIYCTTPGVIVWTDISDLHFS